MEYLPAEIQLKILKNLNFDELIKIKQTNRHFCTFINKYKDELDREKLDQLQFGGASNFLKHKKLISFNLDFVRGMANKFRLSNHLYQKWRSALDKQIPVFIVNTANSDENDLLLFIIPETFQEKILSLKLPVFPKNIKELRIIRYLLLKIFSCVFKYIDCRAFIFNPEMIKLLFDNEEINKYKFNCHWSYISLHLNFDATFDRLVTKEVNITTIKEEDTKILLKLLLNEGYRIPIITLFAFKNQAVFYNIFINHIETSTDLSRIVDFIEFDCGYLSASEIIVRGVEMEESNYKNKYYKITNKHDSKIMFHVLWKFRDYRSDLLTAIRIIKD